MKFRNHVTRWGVRAFALASFLLLAPGAQGQQPTGKYAGIEISSTAVRCVLIEYQEKGKVAVIPIGPGGGQETRTGLIETVVLKAGKKIYPRAELQKVARKVKEYRDELMKNYKVGRDRFYVVASSGVNNGATNIAELIEILKETDDTLPEVEKATFKDELRLGVLGTIPPAAHASAVFIDIGGSNTKFGFAYRGPDGKQQGKVEEIKFGTNTLRKAAEDLAKKEGKSFLEAVHALRASQVLDKMTSGVKVLRATKEGQGREQVFVIGGAPFAAVTLMFPGQMDQAMVAIEYSKFQEYRKVLPKLTEPYVPFGDLPEDKNVLAMFNEDLKTVRKRFTLDQLISGAEMLEGVFEAFGLNKPEKSITFARNALYAWVIKYVEERSSGQLGPTGWAADPIGDLAGDIKLFQEENQQALRALYEKQKTDLQQLKDDLKKLIADKGTPSPVNVSNLENALQRIETMVKQVKDDLQRITSLKTALDDMGGTVKNLTQAVARTDSEITALKTLLKRTPAAADAPPPGNADQAVPPGSGDSATPPALGNKALLVVDLPADAKLFIGGKKMTSTSSRRQIVTPPLLAGERYFYRVWAEIVRDGETLASDTQVIWLYPGKPSNAQFTKFANRVAPK